MKSAESLIIKHFEITSMKKIYFLITFLMSGILIHAQITMMLEAPPVGVVKKPQLWNVLFVNNDAAPDYAALSVVLTNTQTSETALIGGSNVFTLNPGTTQVQATDVGPIVYDYSGGSMTDQDPNGFLPIGEYEACYTLSKQNSGHMEVVTQSCITILVEPLSPPLLNIPADQDSIEDQYPQFNWLPPTPLNIFNNLSYDLILVAVQPGQTALEAIQQNIPIYSISNVTDIFLNYPASNTPLDTAKTYAWQVIAKDNEQFAAQSDVWSFYVKQDIFPAVIKNERPYVKLVQNLGAAVTECKDILKIFYNNEADDTTLIYTISSLSNEDLGTEVKTGTLALHYGENFIDVPLTEGERLLEGKIYLFSLTNSRNETWQIKLLYHQSSNE